MTDLNELLAQLRLLTVQGSINLLNGDEVTPGMITAAQQVLNSNKEMLKDDIEAEKAAAELSELMSTLKLTGTDD